MSEEPALADHPNPNAVLRGGPLDGSLIRVHDWTPVSFAVDNELYVYRPTDELDDEHWTLRVYVIDHIEVLPPVRFYT
ncbi:hypothetical protein KDL01_32490 [Actinospica durhamensis]|uniref:Uncharacterized protein n=1 Tax=Actinospica durhamensis TaxID=1508375 RepID=A0A941ETY0_9ACTN|nr:hypothetical protein [Actinospica durhamensis]MBR7838037.1 hypothetical protein [Actinospica durhamensis]